MKTKFNGILTLLLALVVQISFAQEKTISGTVSDESGPLPGVTILKKGTTQGTETDFDGNYSIKAKIGDVLVYSFIGMKTVEMPVGQSNSINVTMDSDNVLDEVIVTAFGIKRKPDELTTSNQVVKAEQLTQANPLNVATALTGKVSGLNVRQTSSGVNQDYTITLRGMRSFSGSNEALVVIDGVPSTTALFFALDPDSIENVNVLKGPNGAALYGPLGGNGVIVVTTKKGSSNSDKFSVTLKSSVEIETLAYLPERQTRYGQGWASGGVFTHYIYENGAWGPEFDGQQIPIGFPDANGDQRYFTNETLGSDNIADFFQDGITMYNGVTVSGGDQNSGYINLSLSNTNREFIIDNDTFKRNYIAASAGKTFGKLTLGAGIQFTTSSTKSAGGQLYEDLLHTATNIDVTQFSSPRNETHWNGYFFSPYWKRDNIRNFDEAYRTNANLNVGYEINDNISLRSTMGMYISDTNGYDYNNGYVDPIENENLSGFQRTETSTYSEYNNTYKRYYGDLIANFKYNLTEDISLDANLGGTTTQIDRVSSGARGENLTIPGFYNISNVSGTPIVTDFKSQDRSIGGFSDLTLGYKDYLFINATARNEWLSKLSKDNRSFFYPSAGISFIPTKAFNIDNDWLDRLKVSYSYVESGNASAIGPYAINETFNQASGRFYGAFPFGSLNSFIPSAGVTDPNLKPEFITSHEFNVIAEFFKRRVTLDVAGYFGKNIDQIANVSTSYAAGITNNTINIGEAKTSGFEIDLGVTAIKNENWQWDINTAYSTNEMEVTKVSDQTNSVEITNIAGRFGYGIFAEVGEAFPLIKGEDYERDPEGRVIINAEGNPTKTTDLKKLGRTTPKHIVDLNSTLKYKNLSLSVTADYRTGHVFYSGVRSQLSWSGYLIESAQNGRNQFIYPNSVIETSPGVYEPNTTIPTGGPNDSAYLNYYSNIESNTASNQVLDATALKIREISLSYDFSDNVLETLGVSRFQVTASARNPFVFLAGENRGYADPESSLQGGQFSSRAVGITTAGQYPNTRSVSLSLNLSF